MHASDDARVGHVAIFHESLCCPVSADIVNILWKVRERYLRHGFVCHFHFGKISNFHIVHPFHSSINGHFVGVFLCRAEIDRGTMMIISGTIWTLSQASVTQFPPVYLQNSATSVEKIKLAGLLTGAKSACLAGRRIDVNCFRQRE
jgi:hypothetical protein